MNSADIIDESVEYFEKAFSKKGKLDINRQIHKKLDLLREYFELSEDEIFQELFEGYLKKKLYQKYQEEKALSTFITYCVKYGLNDLHKKQKTRNTRNKEKSLESVLDSVLCDTGNRDLHEFGISRLIEFTTPEDLVISMELIKLVTAHFGIFDAKVLLEQEDLHTAAASLSVSYDVYRKRLLRKKLSFVDVLEQAGYPIH
jgi:hypothetical protein